jgi:hypothetical protein
MKSGGDLSPPLFIIGSTTSRFWSKKLGKLIFFSAAYAAANARGLNL